MSRTRLEAPVLPLDRGLVMSIRRPCRLGIHLTAYVELEKIVGAFARGDLNLLILLGSHGLGKSRIVRQALHGHACWLEGNTSVFGLYCQLWHHRHRPVILDDLDGLYASRDASAS